MNYLNEYMILLKKNKSTEEIALELNKYLPDSLYRYRTFNSNYWKREIFNGEVFIGAASNLNDPMDCLIYFDVTQFNDNSNIMIKLCEKYKVSASEIKSIFKMYPQKMEEIIFGLREDIGVASFSEIGDSLLMWSHYANQYNGFCIEYDTHKFGSITKSSILPVIYSKEKPDVQEDIEQLRDSLMLKSVIYKAEEWEYEKEWRIIKPKGNDRLYLHNSIKSIYLGMKTPHENKEEIVQWANKKEISVYLVKPDLKEYKLIKEKISFMGVK